MKDILCKVSFLLILLMVSLPCSAQESEHLIAHVQIDDANSISPAKPFILGNNVAWDETDPDIFQPDSTAFSKDFLAYYDRLKPTTLRYPGGALADFYHWQSGVGTFAQRKKNMTLSKKNKEIVFGTDEFLALCKRAGAEPLISVNVATGTPEEAAAWVAYTNQRAESLQPVFYWEIGNEPYLETVSPEVDMTPEQYAAKANLFIKAMKAQDPRIKVGIPLRSDKIAGTPATPYAGFNDIVLNRITQPFDFISLHSAYAPVTMTKEESPEELYLATMAGTLQIREDIKNTKAQLKKYHPDQSYPIAFTEYNALYSLDMLRYGLLSLVFSKTDRFIDSQAGALYTADVLAFFTMNPDVFMAQYWALNANFWFGAIGHSGKPRAQFYVLEAFRALAGGAPLAVTVDTPKMDTPRAAFVDAFMGVPVVSAFAVKESAEQGNGVSFMLINKHPTQGASVDLSIKNAQDGQIDAKFLEADDYFAHDVHWRQETLQLNNHSAHFTIPAHTVVFADLK